MITGIHKITPAVLFLIFSLSGASCICLHSEEWKAERRKEIRNELDHAYPPREDRQVIQAKYGKPMESIVISANQLSDKVALRYIQVLAQTDHGKTASYDVYMLARTTGAAASFGAVGVLFDYVFYDGSNTVIKAYRYVAD